MCFCRRKTSSKEDAIDSSGRGDSRKQYRDQPMAPPAAVAVGPPQQIRAPPQIKEKTTDKRGKKGKSNPRGVGDRISKKKAKRPREDDTISNIPEEMPDLEINREHAEPFYTDEQLM